MNLALLSTQRLPVPAISGGAIQLYIQEIAPLLAEIYDITVVSPQHQELQDEEYSRKTRHIRLPATSTKEYITNIINIANDFDWIHIFNRPNWVNILSDNSKNTKFSISIHNDIDHPSWDADIVECINRSEFICTVSKFISGRISHKYPMAVPKLKTIYSGVNVKDYDISENNVRDTYGIKEDKVICYVGRLTKNKGVHILIKSMEKILDAHDACLLIVGSTDFGTNKNNKYVKKLKEMSNNINNAKFYYTGFIKPSDIPKFYTASDIFVCPSQHTEALARVHYEAMAAKLPIITTNVGGNAEIISNNGVAINDYKNPSAFSDQIIRLLDNEQLAKEMGVNGRRIVEEHHTWATVASNLHCTILETFT